MSMEAVTAFLRMLDEDDALRQELDPSGKGGEEQLQALVTAGAKKGQEFTVTELKSVLDALRAPASGELGEEELEKAAGGLLSSRTYLSSDLLSRKKLDSYLSSYDYFGKKK